MISKINDDDWYQDKSVIGTKMRDYARCQKRDCDWYENSRL